MTTYRRDTGPDKAGLVHPTAPRRRTGRTWLAVLLAFLLGCVLPVQMPRLDLAAAGKSLAGASRQLAGTAERLVQELPQRDSSSRVHVVQPGDSLAKIAGRYDIPYQALIAANRDAYPSLATNPGLIQVGWKLVIPPKDKAVALAQSVVLPTPAPGLAPTATPVPAGGAAPSPATPAPQQAVKVLYLVGDIDGLDGPATKQSFEDSERGAQALRQMGFDVALFEAGKQHWSDVLKQAPGAKVLIYLGHGTARGDPHHPETVGGIYLAPGEFVTKERVANDLRVMSPGWIAILPSSCYAAGQSGPEWNQDIGVEEAKRRVAAYSEDFLAAGAACYFAGGIPQNILGDLLAGKTCGEAADPHLRSSDLRFQHPSYPNAALWLGRWEVNYAYAFVGNPNARLP